MESFFKATCFTDPEGKVSEVTRGKASGGLREIQVFFAN